METVLWLVALTLAGTAVSWVGSTRLEDAGRKLSAHFGLPSVVHGAVVVAVGSSFPELASVLVAAIRYDTFQLGVSAVVGSAVFNILVIPAVSRLGVDEPLAANRALVYKDALFYLLSILALLGTFAVATVYSPVASGSSVGTLTRELAVVPLALYGLYLYVQYADATDRRVDQVPVDSVARQVGRFVFGLAAILVGVEFLVNAAVGFGDLLGTPDFLWGVTVVAAGTSVPDAIVSARAARVDDSEGSLANVLGSNVFDLLVAVPVGVLVAGSALVDFRVAAPMLGALVAVTVVLFVAIRTGLRLTAREAVLLLACYGLFIGWVALEIAGVTGVLPN